MSSAAPRSGPILVTGAAGFAGGHLLELLARDRLPLVAWHRPGGTPPPSAPAIEPPAVPSVIEPREVTSALGPRAVTSVLWEAVELLDRAAVRAALDRVRPAAVYHCAGAAHVGRSWDKIESTFAINVRGTFNVLEGLREAGVTARVLVPSSAMVYAAADEMLGEDHPLVPASPYALSKLAQELAGCGDPGGPDVLIARAFNHFGPRQDPWFVASGFARRIADIEAGRWAPEITVGNLDSRRDLTDVRDTVRAYRLILERGTPGRPYNVCSGRAIAVRELLEIADPDHGRPGPLPAQRPAAGRRRSQPHSRRAGMDGPDSVRASAGRPLRILAQSMIDRTRHPILAGLTGSGHRPIMGEEKTNGQSPPRPL
jgi:GDP-4-dehydro-6-deoxy-D-mannose reductase